MFRRGGKKAGRETRKKQKRLEEGIEREDGIKGGLEKRRNEEEEERRRGGLEKRGNGEGADWGR
jgi:hypothetical protein